MSNKIKRIISYILVFALIISQVMLLSACGEKEEPVQEEVSFAEDWLLNTYCYIKSFRAGDEEVLKEALKYARTFEHKLSKTISGSLTDQLNDAHGKTGIYVGDETYDLAAILVYSLIFNRLSGGVFDTTVGRLTDLWDFSSGHGTVPDAGEIEYALKFTGSDKITIAEDGEIIKDNMRVKVDFGAIAKGYIGDKVADYLRQNGINSAIISLGGNIVLVGEKNDGSPWQIGIEAPKLVNEKSGALEERESVGMLDVAGDMSVVTSGTYERYLLDNSTDPATIYHHIIDPRTGYSVDTDLVSATIIGSRSVFCDALSTCCILLGSEKAPNIVKAYNALKEDAAPSYEYVLITKDGEIIKSDGAILN